MQRFAPASLELLAARFWRVRRGFLLALVPSLALLVPWAARVAPDNSVDAMSLVEEPALELVHRIESTFGNSEVVSVSFQTDDILSARSLQVVRRITEHARELEGVASILGLTTLWRMESQGGVEDTTLVLRRFLEEDWLRTGVPPAERSRLLSDPVYQGLIYDREGAATAVLVQFERELTASAPLESLRHMLQQLEEETGLRFHMTGHNVLRRTIYGAIEREQLRLPLFMIAAIFLLMLAVYRSALLCIAPTILLGCVYVVVMGILGLLGIRLNWLTSAVPAVIMIVSVCDTMHVIHAAASGGPADEPEVRVRRIYRRVALPCLLTSVTTAIGFLALASLRAQPLREFGLYVALAVVVAFTLSFTLVILFVVRKRRGRDGPRHAAIRWLLRASLRAHRRQGAVCVATLGLLLVSAAGMTRIVVDLHEFRFFKQDPYGLAESNAFVARWRVGGGAETFLLFESTRPGALYEPAALRQIDRMLEAAAEGIPEVVQTLSFVDLIKRANQAIHDGDPSFHRVPERRAEIAQLALLLELAGEHSRLGELVTPDFEQARARVFTVVPERMSEIVRLYRRAEEIVSRHPIPDVRVQMAGRPQVESRMMEYVPRALIQSLVLTISVITILMVILFRSVPVGLIALIPNLMPILVSLGAMGWLGVWLNQATVMVFAVSLGIAVDDTIHLLWSVKRGITAGATYPEAIEEAFDEVGVPITVSTLVLSGAFLVMGTSSLIPMMHFGILVAACCVLALLSDLLLTPIVLMRTKPF